MANTIKHLGIVESIEDHHIQVRIVQTSACASCSIKGHCTSADVKEKLIDIANADTSQYRQGDHVWVVGTLSMGGMAVLLAFIKTSFLYLWQYGRMSCRRLCARCCCLYHIIIY